MCSRHSWDGRPVSVGRRGQSGLAIRWARELDGTGTVLADSNVGFRDWAVAIHLVTTSFKGVSSTRLRRDPGAIHKTAWFMLHRTRGAWASTAGEPMLGPVHADETHVGGKSKNMHTSRRRAMIAERGPVGKSAAVGVKDRTTNRVSARPVADTTAAALVGMVAEAAAPGATVYTDEVRAHKPLASLGYTHAGVPHRVRELVRGDVHTKGIESLWSMFTRGYGAPTTRCQKCICIAPSRSSPDATTSVRSAPKHR